MAVYSDADTTAPHVTLADEAYRLGQAPAVSSYLNVERIILAAERTGADAIHPGYGFLAENADFADACRAAKLTFVGPGGAAMRRLGNKGEARALARSLGLRTPLGTAVTANLHQLQQDSAQIPFPLMVKAVAGGGGLGQRIVESPEALAAALKSARDEAQNAFADDRLYLEQLIQPARHVEVQIFGDHHGNIVHLGTRDCTLQRRRQKLIEEAPAPFLPDSLRDELTRAAVALARAANFHNAGTVEFLVSGETAYFLEVNPRLQVEHPVTEMITGIDLVAWQLQVAAQLPLPLNQAAITFQGHAIEARIVAEDVENGFLPQAGPVLKWATPQRAGLRYDTGVQTGGELTIHYDSLAAKAIACGDTRAQARSRLADGLRQTCLLGVKNNIEHSRLLLESEAFAMGDLDVNRLEPIIRPDHANARQTAALIAALWYWRQGAPRYHPLAAAFTIRFSDQLVKLQRDADQHYRWLIDDEQRPVIILNEGDDWLDLTIADHRMRVAIIAHEDSFWLHAPTIGVQSLRRERRGALAAAGGPVGGHTAPLPAHVIRVAVAVGQDVQQGQTLIVLESMKMENQIRARTSGRVSDILVAAGDMVDKGALLLTLDEDTQHE